MTLERFERQEGQSLVGVLILVALLFFLGTAMSLSVSTSFVALTQSATALKAGYAAESAAAHGAAGVVVSGPSSSCGIPNPFDAEMSVRGPVTWTECLSADVDVSSRRLIAQPPALVRAGKCLTSPVAYSTGQVVWATVAWHAMSGTPALTVLFGKKNQCGPDETQRTCNDNWDGKFAGEAETCREPLCTIQPISTLLYFSCPITASNVYLQLFSNGGDAQVSGFLLRSASSGGDRVVTVVGQAAPSVVEVDVSLPKPAPKSAPSSVGAFHRILP